MTLDADVRERLPEFRQRAEALMADSCTIGEAGEQEYVDGAYVTTPGAAVYSGKCQVQVTDSVTMQGDTVGDVEVTLERVTIKIPVSAPSVPIDSIVTITAVSDVSDPALVGRTYRVTGSHAKTYATARRLPCVLVTP